MVTAIMQFEPVTVCAPDVSKVHSEHRTLSLLQIFAPGTERIPQKPLREEY